jgi:hypothetical protein
VRLSADGSAVASWPPTAFDAWCGEHPDFPAWIESQRKPTVPPASVAETRKQASLARHTTWAERIIAGETPTEIAKLEGIASPYIRESVLKVFRVRNPKLYQSLVGKDYGTTREPSMRSLVKHAVDFGFTAVPSGP